MTTGAVTFFSSFRSSDLSQSIWSYSTLGFSASEWLLIPFGAGLATKGRLRERNQHFLRVIYPARDNPAGSLDAQAEITDYGVSITKNVSPLRIDYIPAESSLLGVWRSHLLKAVGATAQQ
jgi:hypothetical protein